MLFFLLLELLESFSLGFFSMYVLRLAVLPADVILGSGIESLLRRSASASRIPPKLQLTSKLTSHNIPTTNITTNIS